MYDAWYQIVCVRTGPRDKKNLKAAAHHTPHNCESRNFSIVGHRRNQYNQRCISYTGTRAQQLRVSSIKSRGQRWRPRQKKCLLLPASEAAVGVGCGKRKRSTFKTFAPPHHRCARVSVCGPRPLLIFRVSTCCLFTTRQLSRRWRGLFP